MVLSSNLLFSQNKEFQRKYLLEDSKNFLDVNDSSIALESFIIIPKTVYYSNDIYWDTPGLLLFQNQLSLRIRKVITHKGKVEYKIQLKTEMTSEKEARIEIEVESLSSYMLETHEGSRALPELLDLLFQALEDHSNKKIELDEIPDMEVLIRWVQLQSDGFIEPFQVLSDVKKPGLTSEVLAQLRPTVFVFGARKRFLVYDKSDHQVSSVNDFQNLEEIAECSVDSVLSISLQKSKNSELLLQELELENKQETPNMLTQDRIASELELQLKTELLPLLDSKYRQSILFFHKKMK